MSQIGGKHSNANDVYFDMVRLAACIEDKKRRRYDRDCIRSVLPEDLSGVFTSEY